MDKFITTADGVKIKYSVFGNKKNPAVFFITGIGGNSAVWDKYIKPFIKNFYIITNDFRGFGMSDRPKRVEDYKLENFANDLDLILTNENIDTVNMIGHCFGGSVAINYVKRYRKKVGKLVLIETSNEVSHLAKFFVKVKPLMLSFNYFIKILPSWYRKGYQDFSKYKGSWDLEPTHIINDMSRASLFSYLSTLYNYLKYNDNVSEKIDKASLLIAGKKDIVYPTKQLIKLKEMFVNNSFVEIDDNHMLPVNRINELTELIQNFLNEK